MALGPWQIVIVVLLIVLFFGRGRISDMMGDLAKGITSFKKGLREDEDEGQSAASSEPPRIAPQPAPPPAETTVEAKREDSAS
ncbi:twin-arginine translocase TatA/TatE family subunit [Parasphingopyxis algicola]|uniref:twin-arginine translocase TatA/TatE family subunit n=1 Tax=Parasphingopyxis algicola TaxID=2026624 RepID=UPI0015A44DAC|nr:twin-arginine translocase TatA/TatE family subunit [Parasphingopyxis algicola]QLC26306.1 twin-arginine translocase TatA/TatE family subunit [Parasphingopyxis algicola]